MCHCIEYKLSALQVTISEENKLNPRTQQFIIAKIPGCALKQGSKTHSSLRQSNLHRKNQAALMSCPIRAVEHRKCAARLSEPRSNLAELHKNWECARKLSIFCNVWLWKTSKILVFLFLCWVIIKRMNASMLTTAVFELVQQFHHVAETGNVANAVSTCAARP